MLRELAAWRSRSGGVGWLAALLELAAGRSLSGVVGWRFGECRLLG